MEENRVERASKNIIWSGINTVIGLILPFLTQTCLVYVLGVRYVGINGLFSSILEVLNLTELGIGSALIYSMYKPIAENDNKKVCALLALYRKCYHWIGLFIFILGLGIMPFLPKFISGDIPREINIDILFCVYLLNTVISYFMFAYKSSLLYGYQQVDRISVINIVVSIVKTFIQCSAVILMKHYYYFIIVLPITTVLQNLLTYWITSKKYPQYICKGKISKYEIKMLRKKVYGLITQKIGGVVISSADNIVISAFLGLMVLGLYSNYLFIFKALKKLLEAIQTALTPVIGNSIAMESKEKNYYDFRAFLFIYLWIVSWLAICQLCFYQPFIKLWVGEDCLLDNLTMVLFVCYFYFMTAGDLAYTYTQAAGIWWEGKYISLISSVINLIFNLILVSFIGLKGVLLSTILSVILVILPFRGKVLFNNYFEHTKGWYPYMIIHIKHFLITVVAAGITYTMCMFIPKETKISSFFLRGLICIIIPNSFFIYKYYKHPDFNRSIEILIRFIKHK